MAFHNVQFPANLSFGSLGGPERRTEIVTLANGFEERNAPWSQSRRRYDAGMGLRSLDDIADLLAFFEAREGQLYGFRWKDWADYKSCPPLSDPTMTDQVLGTGDGVQDVFQLVKEYSSSPYSYARTISKPVSGTVLVSVGGDAVQELIDYTLDVTTGEITFTHPPDAGAVIRAGFEFDVPVRFDTDGVHVSVASFQAGEVPNIPVIEVRV